jgi:exosortase
MATETTTQTSTAAPEPEMGLREFLSGFPYKGFVALLVVAWSVVFHFQGNSSFGFVHSDSLFVYLKSNFDSVPDDAHGYLIPFLFLGLIWWRREKFAQLPKDIWWPALAVMLAACCLHVLAFTVQQTRISIIAFVIGLYGITGLFWGRPWMWHSFFLFLLFGFCIPLSGVSDPITLPLRLVSTKIAAWIAQNIGGIPVIQMGNRLLDPDGRYQYEVVAACSGIRSLTAMLAITCVYGYMQLSGWWKRGFLILMAFPLAVFANVIRLMMIIVSAEIFGHDAGTFVHENQILSMVPYIPAMLAIFLIGYWLQARRESLSKVEALA